MITPVILSGGSGTRLWPLSRGARPKQFLALTGERTLLQMTALRTAAADVFRKPIVVTNERFAGEVERQLKDVGIKAAAIVLEPVPRNTAPAIALAALTGGSEDVLLVMPSDHVVDDLQAFGRAVQVALPLAHEGRLVTFGIEPASPQTGYGYLRKGDPLTSEAFRVAEFVEKPDRTTAESYVSDGGFLWNGGIFMFQAQAFLHALAEHQPNILEEVTAAMTSCRRDGVFVHPEASRFSNASSISIDHAVMEKSDNVAVVPVEMGWSDIGSWDALYELSAKDKNANSLVGPVILSGSSGCEVRSTGPLVTGIGLEDLIVIATDDAILIVPRERSQEIKIIGEELKGRGHGSLL